jgi:hypothetical protein
MIQVAGYYIHQLLPRLSTSSTSPAEEILAVEDVGVEGPALMAGKK